MNASLSKPRAAPAVHLRIDRLVVDGLPLSSQQGPAFQAALQAELAGLFTRRGLPSALDRSGALDRLDAGRVAFQARPNLFVAAAQVAQAVYRGLNR